MPLHPCFGLWKVLFYSLQEAIKSILLLLNLFLLNLWYEIFWKILPDTSGFFKFSVLHIPMVFWGTTWRFVCRPMASNDFSFCNCYPTKKKWRPKQKKMNNKIMFVIGCIIFVVYVFFLLTIISKQHRIQAKENKNLHDPNDLDGIGNQGRFPTKD